ncbi:MAG: hypothetical protein ACYDEY_11815 [Acidimicrobiales bacterium]
MKAREVKAKAIAGETTRDRAENMANMTTSLPLRDTFRRASDREVATRADFERQLLLTRIAPGNSALQGRDG